MADKGSSKEKKSPVIAGFELISRVGKGGMGSVYRARQISVDRTVALKLLKPELANNKGFISRFREEAKAAASLNHPNIVQAIDAGEEGGYYYFAMEFVDGETLHRAILREGVLEERMCLEIARDMALALGHANQHSIVHRDIKPGNIMITRAGIPKLCDLGLARVMADEDPQGGRGAAVGTPYYISPEQAQGIANVDTRSDIYSLGATLFRALVGQPVFNAPTPAEILEHHVHSPVPWPQDYNPELSEDVCYLIVKMMAKKPEERYQTPTELAEDIERALAGERPKSTVMELATPPSRLSDEEREKKALTVTRRKKTREAVNNLAEVRELIDIVAQEKSLPPHGVVRLLRGNLDETKADTFLKYGVILLAEKKFSHARREFHKAQELGADVSAFIAKIDALGAPTGMVYIPQGDFPSGPTDKAKTQTIDPFYMDANLVTNKKFHDFMRATGTGAPPHWIDNNLPEGMEEFPVTNITWDEAAAFAQWSKKRLPTAIEWEKSARGHEGLAYPWGNDFDPLRCNAKESGHGQLTLVGRYPKGRSPYGCCDMYGNAIQWCADIVPVQDGPTDGRVVCGVSFEEEGAPQALWLRRARKHLRRSRKCGFRCALDV
jgi:serine/threonine protein kinase